VHSLCDGFAQGGEIFHDQNSHGHHPTLCSSNDAKRQAQHSRVREFLPLFMRMQNLHYHYLVVNNSKALRNLTSSHAYSGEVLVCRKPIDCKVLLVNDMGFL
jgi:hypothetical protein